MAELRARLFDNAVCDVVWTAPAPPRGGARGGFAWTADGESIVVICSRPVVSEAEVTEPEECEKLAESGSMILTAHSFLPSLAEIRLGWASPSRELRAYPERLVLHL